LRLATRSQLSAEVEVVPGTHVLDGLGLGRGAGASGAQRGPCWWSGSCLLGGGVAICWVVAQVGADPEGHLGVPPRSTVAGRAVRR
jgi:hypothetical protein